MDWCNTQVEVKKLGSVERYDNIALRGWATGSSVWIFADDWSTYNTEKEQGKQKGKRNKKFRIRPRSSVAPVSSPLHTKTRYGAVSRLPWARLPMVLSWFETPSSRPTCDEAWYLPKERYTEENFRAWTFVISRFKIFLSNVCWAASWEVVPCIIEDWILPMSMLFRCIDLLGPL